MSPLRAAAPRALAIGAIAALVAGCVVGPRYARPAPPSPDTGAFASATPSITSADQPPNNWWRLYDTPPIDQLVQAALSHNKSLLVAVANLAEARAALSQAQAGLFPTTTTTANMQYGVSSEAAFLSQFLTSKGPAPFQYYTAALDASYEVDLFGRVRRTIQAAKADYQAQKAAADVIRISVAGETTRAYLNACAYAEELDVARQSVDVATQTYQVTVKEARDGTASDFDLARAREQVAQVQATLPTLEGERRTALFQLAVLTGQPPEEISKAADGCRSPPKLNTALPLGDLQSLFRRRPDVLQAERQLAANVARIGVATADLYPTITIGASVGSSATTPEGLASARNLNYGIGPLLNWTFPNTLVALAEIREARATASASYANFDAVVLQALQDVESSVTAYGGELERNAALITARDQSRIAFKLAQIQFRFGRVSYLDLLTAQNDLVSASAALAVSDQTLASDQVTVFKALGGGWEQAPNIQPLPIKDGRSGKDIKVK